MANYIVIKELRAPTKIAKNFYITDFFFVFCYFAIGLFIRDLVIRPLQLPFFIYNTVIALLLVSHSKSNPGMRFYKVIYLWQQKDSILYKPVQNVSCNKIKEEMQRAIKTQKE